MSKQSIATHYFTGQIIMLIITDVCHENYTRISVLSYPYIDPQVISHGVQTYKDKLRQSALKIQGSCRSHLNDSTIAR